MKTDPSSHSYSPIGTLVWKLALLGSFSLLAVYIVFKMLAGLINHL